MVNGEGKQESLQLLQVDEFVLEELCALNLRGASLDEMVAMLRGKGVPKVGASLALRLANLTSLEEARAIVETSEAYASWPASWQRQTTTGVSDAKAA